MDIKPLDFFKSLPTEAMTEEQLNELPFSNKVVRAAERRLKKLEDLTAIGEDLNLTKARIHLMIHQYCNHFGLTVPKQADIKHARELKRTESLQTLANSSIHETTVLEYMKKLATEDEMSLEEITDVLNAEGIDVERTDLQAINKLHDLQIETTLSDIRCSFCNKRLRPQAKMKTVIDKHVCTSPKCREEYGKQYRQKYYQRENVKDRMAEHNAQQYIDNITARRASSREKIEEIRKRRVEEAKAKGIGVDQCQYCPLEFAQSPEHPISIHTPVRVHIESAHPEINWQDVKKCYHN